MVGVGLVVWRCRGYMYWVPAMYPALRWTLYMLPWAHLATLAGRRLEKTRPQESLCNGSGGRGVDSGSCEARAASLSSTFHFKLLLVQESLFLSTSQVSKSSPGWQWISPLCVTDQLLQGHRSITLVAAAQGWDWIVHVQGPQWVFISFLYYDLRVQEKILTSQEQRLMIFITGPFWTCYSFIELCEISDH